jgi:ribosomal protein L29
MKMKEITELSTDELLTKRRDLRQESLHLRLQQQSGQLEQPSRLRLLRRDVARIQTALAQRAKETEKNKFMAEQDEQSFPKPPPLLANVTRGSRKTRTGQVVSSSMNKTIVVRTVTRVPHPKFGKIVNQMRKFYAHDEENKAKTATRFASWRRVR